MSTPTDAARSQTPAHASGGRSHIAAGAKLTGDLSVPGLVELLGHVDGTISADKIVIEEAGSVSGELRAAGIAIRGRFEGRIDAGDVILHAGAEVSGEISYTTLSVESGARLDATCSRKTAA